MKTLLNIRNSIALLLCFFVLTSSAPYIKRCPVNYYIDNQLSCDITVDVAAVDICPANWASPCMTGTLLNIPANTVWQIPCGTCTNICDIQVTITDIGGTTVNITADINNAGTITNCGGNSITYNGISTFVVN